MKLEKRGALQFAKKQMSSYGASCFITIYFVLIPSYVVFPWSMNVFRILNKKCSCPSKLEESVRLLQEKISKFRGPTNDSFLFFFCFFWGIRFFRNKRRKKALSYLEELDEIKNFWKSKKRIYCRSTIKVKNKITLKVKKSLN